MEGQSGKKKFPIPSQANQSGEIGIRTEAANHPLHPKSKPSGGSVDEHRNLEDANEYMAQKEISQVFNNS